MSDLENIQEHCSKIKSMIEHHQLVENLVHRQGMLRHDLVENLLHQNNLSELRRLLDKLECQTLAHVLEALSTNERQVIWQIVSHAHKPDILFAVSDSVREELTFNSSLQSQSIIIRAFDIHDGCLRQIPIFSREDLAQSKPIWIDLVKPESEQIAWVKEIFGVNLPNPKEVIALESSTRFYEEENGEIHLHSAFLLDRDGKAQNVAVTYVLNKDALFSVRNEEFPAFRLKRLRARVQMGYVVEAKDVLLDLYATDVEYSANALGDVYVRLDMVGRQVFASYMTNEQAAKNLTAISVEEDLNGRIRRNILDTRNALSFLMRQKFLSTAQHEDIRETLRDIESIDGHTTFLFNKINFQMDATVGFLNVNQNKDLKRLTIISVVFIPLNVLAGIGGMSEFSMMTRAFPWPIAYSLFMIAIIIIGSLTYIGLKYMERSKIKNYLTENK